ncbi:MAG TPA: hypothetical protein VGB50_13000 [Flavobacterium sp.]|jgi:hypothetical protein
MIPKYAVPENPYVTLQNKVIKIRCDRQNINLAVDEVMNIYLKKRKGSFFSALSGMGFFTEESSYNLHISTRDNKEIKVKVKAVERPFLIALISCVRNLKKENAVQRPTRKISRLSGTVAA